MYYIYISGRSPQAWPWKKNGEKKKKNPNLLALAYSFIL